MNFGNWLEHYLYTFKRQNVKKSTYDFYNNIREVLKPLFEIDLNELNIFIIQDFANQLYEQSYAHSTVKHCVNLISQACRKAITAHLIKINPCDGVELQHRPRPEIECLTPAEISMLRNTEHRSIYYNVFLFLMYTGMRTGEMIALDWRDLDYAKQVIHICRNFYRGEVTTPKTGHGIRDLPLTTQILSTLPRRQLAGNVFLNTMGRMIDYRILLTSWHRQQESTGFPNLYGLHALRHTFATTLIRNGADAKTVAMLLGHADVSITLNYYCHSDLEDKRRALSLLDFSI